MTTPALHAHGIHKSFGAREVLTGIDLSVTRGEVVCLVGPSGSGKSTLLRCLNWLAPPSQGEVWLGDTLLGQQALADGSRAPLPAKLLRRQRSRIGMVFQHFNLWPHMTAMENVMEGPRAVLRMSKAVAQDLAMTTLTRVGLSDRAQHYPAQLSGGQQQRVAIARALVMQPEILLFDEPTSALDPELVGEVLDVMADLAFRRTTMIVVTHELGFAAAAADRIIMMDGGRIIESGTPRQILAEPSLPRTHLFVARYLARNAALSALTAARSDLPG
jgi:polar amino acid transport system ATP-binding protein